MRFHSSSVPQTFLLPFDPEDHEDADEWKEYQGELSSKELQKVNVAGECGVECNEGRTEAQLRP